jgi:hypothetical protein
VVASDALWRVAAEEKNAFVCLTLLKDLFERRATAPLAVSMVEEKVTSWKNLSNNLEIPTRRIYFSHSRLRPT